MLEESGADLSPGQYIQHVNELSQNVAAVYDLGNKNAQIQGLLNSLTTVALAFAQLPGMPPSLTKSINKVLTSIEEGASQVPGADGSNKELESLKNVLNGAVNDSVKTQIESRIEEGTLSDEEKSDLCEAYQEMSGGIGDPPAGCE